MQMEHPVNVAVDLFWPCIAADGEHSAIGGRQAHCDDLVSGQLAAQGLPGGVDTLLQKGALNTDQQVVGQHTQKDVGFDPSLQMMKDGSLAQGAFHGAEGSLDPRQQNMLGWEHISFNGDYVWPSEPFKDGFRPLRNPRSAFLDAA
jgi:hypothetical protein